MGREAGMRGIAAREKRYVEVISRTDEEGRVTPLVVSGRTGAATT